MTLTKAKKFHIFCFGLFMLIPLSSATAGFGGMADYPARAQFPGVGHQGFPNASAPYAWQSWRNWNYLQALPGRMGFLPNPHYRGYPFRTMQRNYFNNPGFPPQASSYRFASYRWRPMDHRQSVIHRGRAYQRPEWRVMPGFQDGRPRYVSRPWENSPFRQPVPHPGRGFRFRPLPSNESITIANRAYRATENIIPAHYVFRPIMPAARHSTVAKDAAYSVQNMSQNRSEVVRERYTGAQRGLGQMPAYQQSAARFDRPSLLPKVPLKYIPSDGFQLPVQKRYAQMRYPHERPPTFASRHQIRGLPKWRPAFRYPVQPYPSFPAGQIQKSVTQGFMPHPVPRYNDASWPQPSFAHIRNGPNWYDGHADKEGAWYSIDQTDGWLLASRSERHATTSLDF